MRPVAHRLATVQLAGLITCLLAVALITGRP
jgi:hypothetical protein